LETLVPKVVTLNALNHVVTVVLFDLQQCAAISATAELFYCNIAV